MNYTLIDIIENAVKYIHILNKAGIKTKRFGIFFRIQHESINNETIIDYTELKQIAEKIS